MIVHQPVRSVTGVVGLVSPDNRPRDAHVELRGTDMGLLKDFGIVCR